MNPSAHAALPALTPEEAGHSRAVTAHIARHIREHGGWIDFGSFMRLALYAPGLGYYSAGSVKFGAAGDFVTAPEVSPLFARCVARQCADVLGELGGGGILEFGAGTGALTAEVLCRLDALGAAPARYDILEVGADLRERQRARLGQLPRHLAERVRWLSRLPEEPLTGVVLANEVLDALPCRRFVVRGAGIAELGVALADAAPEGAGAAGAEGRAAGGAVGGSGGRRAVDPADGVTGGAGEAGTLVLREAQADVPLREAWRALQPALSAPLGEGYTSELCLNVAPWIAGVAGALARGAVLLFDYGLPRPQYYHPQRAAGTLTCHFKHRAHGEALLNVGVQDITAWVDFTRVAEAADAGGLEVLGFATQAAVLLGLGLTELLAAAPAEQARPAMDVEGRVTGAPAGGVLEGVRLAGEARRLLLPGEMGEAFKLMALGRGLSRPLAAFTHQDLRDSL